MLYVVAREKFLMDCVARGLAQSTRNRYQNDLDLLCRFAGKFHSVHLEEITTELLREFFSDLLSRDNRCRENSKLSPFTVEGIYRTIKTFFNFC